MSTNANAQTAALKFGPIDGQQSERNCTCGHRHGRKRATTYKADGWLTKHICAVCPCRHFTAATSNERLAGSKRT